MTTIKTTLKRLSETPDTSKLHRHLFEGRLYSKLFLVIAVYTENLALTRNQLANIFKKHKFETNTTKHLFNEQGVIGALVKPTINMDSIEDECLNDAVESGAEDIEVHDAKERQVTFFCDPNEIVKVKQKLSSLGHEIVHSECVFEPKIPAANLSEAEIANYDLFKEKLRSMVDGFDEIYANLDEEDEESE